MTTAVLFGRAPTRVDARLHATYDAPMRYVATRELKQNPQSVIQRVLETGEDHEITSYGKSTGVRMVRNDPRPKRWVRESEMPEITPMSEENTDSWLRDLDDLYADDDFVNPWERP